MNRIIDEEKCIGCGLCVRDCINQNIILRDSDGRTVARFKERGWCIECGHCNAVCPQEAVVGGKVMVCDETSDFFSMLLKKRTVRHFSKEHEISQNVLDKILLAGQTAPTDRNRESARIVLVKKELPVVYNKALDYLVNEVKKTGTINPLYSSTMRMESNREEILNNAEFLVILGGIESILTDAIIAAERMQLAAELLGVGTAYRGDMKNAINHSKELKEIIGLKKNESVLVGFAMGYPEFSYQRPIIKIKHKVERK